MTKKSKQKLFLTITALCVLVTIAIGTANAGLDDRIENFFDPKPMPIDLINNPISVTGTYEIERFVINDGDNVFLDSDNDYVVVEDRGEMSINLNMASNVIDMAFRMQMTGPSFAKNSAFAPYAFIYENKTISIPADGKNMMEKLEKIGIHVYEHDKIVWEIPFEGTKTIILILEKESDRVRKISNSKYLFL